MKIRCADVVVQKRVRKDLGELDGLMESIRLLGLLQPIGITKQNVLVFGQRRLIACQMLGHEEIEAKVVDVPSIVDGEYAENEIRKDFTVSERVAIAKELEDGIGERRGGSRGIPRSGVKTQKVADCKDQTLGERNSLNCRWCCGFWEP